MTTKICKTCKQEKPLEAFTRDNQKKDGYRNECKECRKTSRKNPKFTREQERERIAKTLEDGEKECIKCGIIKPLDSFSKHKSGYRNVCKECIRKRRNERYREERNVVIREVKEGYRYCSKCDTEKPVDEFYTFKGVPKGYCKECTKEDRRAYRKTEKAKQYWEKYSHKEDVKEKRKETMKKYRCSEHGKQVKKACANNRRANKNALPDTLTSNEWVDILNDFDNKCPLTGSEDISLEHFIPLSILHGGNIKGNVYPMKKSLNYCKSNKNPFKWIKTQDGKMQHLFNIVLVPYLAEQNGMTIKEFTKYVNWCFKNKRTREQADEDLAKGITSKDLFYEAMKEEVA